MLVSASRSPSFPAVLPGLVLCAAVTLAAHLVERLQLMIFGSHWIESLVLAILIGIAVRSSVCLPQTFIPGIQFAAKTLLEIAVVLLGASLSTAAIRQAGLPLVGGIAVLVALSLAKQLSDRTALRTVGQPGDLGCLRQLDLRQFCDCRRSARDRRQTG